jgi:hypothetical protein
MGQLLGVVSCPDEGTVDNRPKIFSECLVNGRLNGQRYLQFKKRSHDESQQRLSELLFSKSSLLEEEAEESPSVLPPATKKKRKEKQVVMYTDRLTGDRRRLYPMMSLWYDASYSPHLCCLFMVLIILILSNLAPGITCMLSSRM